MSEQKDYIEISTVIMGYEVMARVEPDQYQIHLPEWSGCQTDIAEISKLMGFLNIVHEQYRALRAVYLPESVTDSQPAPAAGSVTPKCVKNDANCPNPGWPVPCPKCNFCSQMTEEDENQATPSSEQPAPLPTSISAAIDETLTEEQAAAWTEAATEADFASQPSDSCYLFDGLADDEWDEWNDDEWYDDHGDDWSYYGSDDDDEDEDDEDADDGSGHASRDPLSGKLYCPYCNSECVPDFCHGCHSELTPPAIDTEIRTDLPEEPPF